MSVESELIVLDGSPAARGERMGQAQRSLLDQSLKTFRERCAGQQVDLTELPQRARSLSTLISSLVPEWIIEARATAAGANVPVATYLAFSSAPDVMHEQLKGPLGEGGTAYAAAGASCDGARAVLHLNRDGRRTPQFVLSRAASPGTLAYVGLGGGAELGVHAFVNESGLAGCWQPGPEVGDPGNGLRAQLILRALAERAVNCRQAVQYFGELLGRYGLYTPGGRGLIFLLADSSGEMAQLEARALKFATSIQTQGLRIVANQFMLPDSPGGPQARDVPRQRKLGEYLLSMPLSAMRAVTGARLYNDPSEQGVCNKSSVAGFTAVLGSRAMPGWAIVSVGNPRCVQPIPLFPGLGVPLPLLDGSAWEAAEALREKFGPQGVDDAKRAALDEHLARIVAPLFGATIGPLEGSAVTKEAYGDLLNFMDEANAPGG